MNRRFAILLASGLALIGAALWYTVSTNQSRLVTLKGSVLKVRTLAFDANATLVLVDFRIANPSEVPFEVKNIDLEMDPSVPRKQDQPAKDPQATPPIPAGLLTKADINRVFEYEKRVGPRENDTLGEGDRIGPGKTADRMIAARIDLPKADVDARTRLRIRIRDFNGPVAQFVELRSLR